MPVGWYRLLDLLDDARLLGNVARVAGAASRVLALSHDVLAGLAEFLAVVDLAPTRDASSCAISRTVKEPNWAYHPGAAVAAVESLGLSDGRAEREGVDVTVVVVVVVTDSVTVTVDVGGPA